MIVLKHRIYSAIDTTKPGRYLAGLSLQKGKQQMTRGKKTPEIKLEVVDAGEMSQEDADVVVQILAKMIYDSILREAMEQATEIREGSGAGSQA